MLALVRERAVVVILALALGGCRHPNDIAWSFATPRPWVLAGDSQALTPAIADDVVFFCGGYDGKELSQVYSLELRTGKPKWQFGVGTWWSAPWRSLAAGGGLVS